MTVVKLKLLMAQAVEISSLAILPEGSPFLFLQRLAEASSIAQMIWIKTARFARAFTFNKISHVKQTKLLFFLATLELG